MATTSESPNPPYQDLHASSALQVDWSWKKWQSRIYSPSAPSTTMYTVHYNFFKSPDITVKAGPSSPSSSSSSPTTSTVIGTGILHPISINADYTVHNRKGKLKALKRWTTEYTHLSYAYASSPEGPPAPMRWTSSSHFKSWDFICLDEREMPVAKFSANWIGLTKVATIDFLGPKAGSEAARDEIVVTGLTLYSCMVLRVNNLGNLVGAIFARPGPIKEREQEGGVKETGDGKAKAKTP
ncbi:MAG: hypothetical protein LQ346_005148 [Caloplaca aetnensis]|nr:MAG: hypothetical protein LQ346_005148 [Caloplaca aetnensis]